MKHELIHLSRMAALSLAVICAPCLQAQEQEPRKSEVEAPLALHADETWNIKWDEPASDILILGDILEQATQNEDTPPNGPPKPPPPPPTLPPLRVSCDTWGFSDYIWRVEPEHFYAESMVYISGGQPPYNVTVERCWLDKFDPLSGFDIDSEYYPGRPHGHVSFGCDPHLPPWQPNLFGYGSIYPESLAELNNIYWGQGNYRGVGKIIVTDMAGNHAETLFPVIVRLL